MENLITFLIIAMVLLFLLFSCVGVGIALKDGIAVLIVAIGDLLTFVFFVLLALLTKQIIQDWGVNWISLFFYAALLLWFLACIPSIIVESIAYRIRHKVPIAQAIVCSAGINYVIGYASILIGYYVLIFLEAIHAFAS